MNLPRVTEVLQPFTNFGSIPPQVLSRKANIGTSVHALCAGIAKGEWIPDSMIKEELKGYVNSFKQWSEAQVTKFVIVEKRFQDEERRYTGQLDYVVLGNDNKLYLVDLKTSVSPQKTYPVQMAAYNNLLRINNIKVDGAMLVYLSKEGEFPDVHLLEDMSMEWIVFSAALDCYHYFNKRKTHDRDNRTQAGNEASP